MGDVAEIPMLTKMTDQVMNIGDALELAYETEVSLMKQYQTFYEESEEKYKDCVTATFLIEFLQIQRKSVGQYGDLISRYEKNKTDVFQFDKEMGKL